MNMSHTERLILSNQYEILAKLNPEKAASYQRASTIIRPTADLPLRQQASTAICSTAELLSRKRASSQRASTAVRPAADT